MRRGAVFLVALFVVAATSEAQSEQAVQIGSAFALLDKPANPVGSVILVPGGDGQLGVQPDGTFSALKGNQLVRSRAQYVSHGLAALTIDRGVDVAAAVTYMSKVAKPVVVVATSRGSLRVARALSAKPAGLVLTASFLDEVRAEVGNPAALPPTLVIHHRQDDCKKTPPSAVGPFASWGGAKVTVKWFDGGNNVGDPCQARAYHGFNGLDGAVVATVASFVQARKEATK